MGLHNMDYKKIDTKDLLSKDWFLAGQKGDFHQPESHDQVRDVAVKMH